MDLQEELPSTHAPSSFWGVWKRWMIWFFAFSVSYYVLVAIGYSSHGCVTDGAFVSFFGIQGNTVFASIISLLIGLVQRITKWRWFPTTIKGGSMRAIIIGLVFGVFSAFTSHAILVCSAEEIENQAASVKPSVSSCVSLYDQGKYQDARSLCQDVSFQQIPRLQALRTNKNLKNVIGLINDEFNLTYTMALLYKHFDEPENARQMALHAVGWGIMSMHLDSLETVSITAKIDKLNYAFPGVKDAESKAFQESFHTAP